MSKRKKVYRTCLCLVLGIALTVLAGLKSWQLYNSVPANIKIVAGSRQQINFPLPVSGTIYKEAVPALGMDLKESADNSLNMNLRDSVTFVANEIENYTMELKLLGMIPFKNVDVQVIQEKMVTPIGMPVGIYVKTAGVLVIATGEFDSLGGEKVEPSKYLLQEGDYILAIDGEEIDKKKAVIEKIHNSEGRALTFTIKREEAIFDLSIQPHQNESGDYKLGIWIRDNAQGVGTLTYMDDEGTFGALGHGINDMDTATLMNLKSGSLYKTEIVSITKGENGTPGELTGIIEYTEENKIGEINANTNEGIFGSLQEQVPGQMIHESMPVGLKQTVKPGPAQILCCIGEKSEFYDVEITAIHLDNDNINRGIELKITDPVLLEETGGIVQGMSGSPIIQEGNVIGAVTHVLVQDPARGYGIFIENMLLLR